MNSCEDLMRERERAVIVRGVINDRGLLQCAVESNSVDLPVVSIPCPQLRQLTDEELMCVVLQYA